MAQAQAQPGAVPVPAAPTLVAAAAAPALVAAAAPPTLVAVPAPPTLVARPLQPGPYAVALGGAGPGASLGPPVLRPVPAAAPPPRPIVLQPAPPPPAGLPPPVLRPLAPGSPPPPKTLRIPVLTPRVLAPPVLAPLPPDASGALPPRPPLLSPVLQPLPPNAPVPRGVVLGPLPPNSPPPPALAKKLAGAAEAPPPPPPGDGGIPDAPPDHGLRKTHVRRSSSYGSAFGDLLAGQCGLDPDAASFAPPPGAPPPPPLTPPRPSPKISRKSVEDESATAAAIDAALRGLSPPAPRGKHRGSVDDEAAAIDAALRGLTPPATPLSSRSPLRKRVEPRAPSLSVDSARSALSGCSHVRIWDVKVRVLVQCVAVELSRRSNLSEPASRRGAPPWNTQ